MRNPARFGSVLIATTTAAPFAWAGQAGDGRYGYGPMWDDGWGGMFFGPFMMILFIAVIVAVVVLIVRWLGGAQGGTSGGGGRRTPIEILEERFARGEIDKDEFEERRRILGG